jgi:hypothetical protein
MTDIFTLLILPLFTSTAEINTLKTRSKQAATNRSSPFSKNSQLRIPASTGHSPSPEILLVMVYTESNQQS